MRPKLVLLMALASLASQPSSASNLLVNGSFEAATDAAALGIISLNPVATNIPGWTTANAELTWDGPWLGISPPLSAAEGSDFVDLSGYHDASPYGAVFQTIPTTIGQQYHVSFELGSDQYYDSYDSGVFVAPGVMVSLNGTNTFTASNNFPSLTNYWHTWSFDFTATATQTTIMFTGTNTTRLAYIGLDNVMVTTVGSPPLAPDYDWEFDETNGTTAFPSAGFVNGTLQGGATFVSGAGINGGAVQFNPATDDIVVFTNFDFSASFTVQAWVKVNRGDTTGYAPVSQHFTGMNDGMFLAINDTQDPGVGSGYVNKAHFYVSGAPTGPSTTSVNDGQWHQLVGVCSYNTNSGSRTLQIFVDGALENSGSVGAYVGNSVRFVAGGVSPNGTPQNSYRGLVDDVRVYFSALSADAVQTIYLDTLPPALSISLSPPTVQLSWNSRPTKMYQLQSSTNLAAANPWIPVGTPVQGNGVTNSTTAPYTGQSTFYRLSVAP
ncbi:MAG: LamG-like jellyroll fold domain-containing protein [Limisphaerales bacterium]